MLKWCILDNYIQPIEYLKFKILWHLTFGLELFCMFWFNCNPWPNTLSPCVLRCRFGVYALDLIPIDPRKVESELCFNVQAPRIQVILSDCLDGRLGLSSLFYAYLKAPGRSYGSHHRWHEQKTAFKSHIKIKLSTEGPEGRWTDGVCGTYSDSKTSQSDSLAIYGKDVQNAERLLQGQVHRADGWKPREVSLLFILFAHWSIWNSAQGLWVFSPRKSSLWRVTGAQLILLRDPWGAAPSCAWETCLQVEGGRLLTGNGGGAHGMRPTGFGVRRTWS